MSKYVSLLVFLALSAPLLSAGMEKPGAQAAWESLVSAKLKKMPAFDYLQPEEKLPNVLLYGDSISIGYTQSVRSKLAGKANVFRLHANGNHSGMFIKLMNQMHTTMRDGKLDKPWTHQWDVIHFNVGLHDLKYVVQGKGMDKENGTQVSSIALYQQNLKKIIAYLKTEHPKAKLIFATTTPVPKGEPGRFVEDAPKYNKAALEVLEAHPEIVVNDLFTFVKPNHSKWWTRPGNVHYSSDGSAQLGKRVAKSISKALAAGTE